MSVVVKIFSLSSLKTEFVASKSASNRFVIWCALISEYAGIFVHYSCAKNAPKEKQFIQF